MSDCGADTLANQLLIALTAGIDFDLPEIDLSDPEYNIPVGGALPAPVKLTNADLTTKMVGGTGTFDFLMGGFAAHLKAEFDKNRITGAEYTKTYIALSEAAMSNATQFLLGRDQAYWSAVTAQLQAEMAKIATVTARVQLETAKVQLQALRYEALTAQATYGLTKMKIATEEIQYCTGKFQLENILPKQVVLTQEQVETQRSQTLDTRSDGVPVTGSVGKQKDLYSQQIISYKRDAEVKAAKLFTDAWTVMKTIDEGLSPPTGFTNASLDTVLTAVKLNNLLG